MPSPIQNYYLARRERLEADDREPERTPSARHDADAMRGLLLIALIACTPVAFVAAIMLILQLGR